MVKDPLGKIRELKQATKTDYEKDLEQRVSCLFDMNLDII
jgi:hypothetical protein